MAIQKFHRFDSDTRYYTGQGCLVCGTNLGPQIDLGVYDQIDGVIALCEDHARECGVYAGMVSRDEVADEVARVESLLADAERERADTEEARDEAKAERHAAEKFMERVLQRAGIIERPTDVVAGDEAKKAAK